MIGTKLSHYTLEERLGAGGMGEVYRARDERLGRQVAIKLLAAAGADEEAVARFVREAKAASALNHPGIVTVHEIDHEGETPFLVMELVEGTPLSDLAGEPMPLERFLDIATQVTGALAAAHQAGIVHRDIKPANVMVRPSGQVKVVDFGLARLAPPLAGGGTQLDTATWQAPTQAGTVLGTVGYMAPEQVEGRPADARADVFALGVLFHELLTGRAPFEGESPISTMSAILRDEPARVDAERRDVPAQLADLIDRCLAKRAEERPASAAEVDGELREIAASLAARPAAPRRLWPMAVAGLLVLALLAGVLAVRWHQEAGQRWVRTEALPEIQRLASEDQIHAAFRLALRARNVAPDDPQLQQLWYDLTFPFSITTDPPGAEVALRDYKDSEAEWLALGSTPLEGARLPFAVSRVRLTREGHAPLEVAPQVSQATFAYRLHRPEEIPDGMVAVAAGAVTYWDTTLELPDFWIDRHEVTNREFQRFVDAGGYRRPELWQHPFVEDGRTLAFEQAMAELVDATGLPGPATWELGTYPEGKGDHPVEGVSWYEAAAYAEFVDKSLPTVYHWARAAGLPPFFSDILVMSNFSGRDTVPAGSLGGLGHWGTYDMAGNVKEWCLNAAGERRYILGGSWLDPSYRYAERDAQPPFERRPGFGFRLIRQAKPVSGEAADEVPVVPPAAPEPADDATFAIYKALYDYDPAPLDPRLDEVDDSHAAWRREVVSFTAAYPGERVPVHILLPRRGEPPFQTVVVFPGADATLLHSSREMDLRWFEPFVRSGRAVVYPIYRGTFERRVPGPLGPRAMGDLRIQQVKDVRRTLDYIETRADLDSQRLLYYGLSMGSHRGPLTLAVEPRFPAAILLAGGLIAPGTPEVRQENFLPRVTVPVLFVTSRHDFMLPYETSQRPLFELLGTPPDRKRHVVLEGGHVPEPFNDAVREMLAWADRWLGPVEGPAGR